MTNTLYVFDMDYTLLAADSSTMWCRYLAEYNLVADPQAFLTREKELMDAYDRGEMDVHDYIAFSNAAVSNKSAAELDKICEDYVQSTLPQLIFPEAKALVTRLLTAGERCVVISASAGMIVRKAAALFGLKEVLAVECEIKDGFYTGKISGLPPFKSGKVDALKAYQKQHGLENAQVHFYTDSINDLPLCLSADEVSVVNPGQALLNEAKARGFEVLHWKLQA